jgi:hypothetical protein
VNISSESSGKRRGGGARGGGGEEIDKNRWKRQKKLRTGRGGNLHSKRELLSAVLRPGVLLVEDGPVVDANARLDPLPRSSKVHQLDLGQVGLVWVAAAVVVERLEADSGVPEERVVVERIVALRRRERAAAQEDQQPKDHPSIFLPLDSKRDSEEIRSARLLSISAESCQP